MRRKNVKTEATKSASTLLLGMLLLAGCGGGSGGSAAPTATMTSAATSTATVVATSAPTSTSTPVPPATATTKVTATPVDTVTAAPTAFETATPVDTVTATATSADTPTATATATATPTDTPTPTQTPTGVLPIAAAVARDANGVALHLNETITTEGVVTVSANVFANNKLKVFMQDGPDGIMVYHQSSADVDVFLHAGDRLRATGVVIQKDPTSDANPANGTVAINLTGQQPPTVLSSGNPLPTPRAVDLATLEATGNDYTGSLVQIANLKKVAGNWPAAGSKSTQVTVSDDGGTTTAILRFQKNTITQVMADKLTAIGDGTFGLVAIVVQDDPSSDGTLLSGYELWVRGADDIQPSP